jgi:hypothetical protein
MDPGGVNLARRDLCAKNSSPAANKKKLEREMCGDEAS